MTLALVLGGGGVTGIAWETGLLKGLLDAGVDLTGADLVVGTSAGSIVGTQITTGSALTDLYERQTAEVAATERPPDLGKLMEMFAKRAEKAESGRPVERPTREVLAWIGSQARAARTRYSEESRLRVIASRLPVHEWPDRPLIVTAIDTGDGTFVTWERSAGVPLVQAVASSCAVPWVYPPVTIGRRRYMDGGVRSSTNAELASGHDQVVIVAPTGGMEGRAALLELEAAELRAAGSRVEVVVPDADALAAFGPNPLDPRQRVASARAGLAQAAAVAATLAAAAS